MTDAEALFECQKEIRRLRSVVRNLEIELEESNKLQTRVRGGVLEATVSPDADYPGIDIEFIPDERTDNVCNPRVLVEKLRDSNILRALIWADPDKEDYTEEVILSE